MKIQHSFCFSVRKIGPAGRTDREYTPRESNFKTVVTNLEVPFLRPVVSFLWRSNDPSTPVPLTVLWNVYGDCDNYATLKGHSGAVMELHYNTDGR